jgi:hypothetical protein
MLYELTASSLRAQQLRIAEPPMGYRRRGRTRSSMDRSRAPHLSHVPSERIEMLVRTRDGEARWRRILELNQRVSAGTRGNVHAAWLQLEESLHDYWFDVALEHYYAGFDAGVAWASGLLDTENPLPLRERLRLLAAALARIADEQEED